MEKKNKNYKVVLILDQIISNFEDRISELSLMADLQDMGGKNDG
mgnify:CR=1 FL=1